MMIYSNSRRSPSYCHVIVVWLFLAVPWVRLQLVIVVFPGHTHFLISAPKPFKIRYSQCKNTLITETSMEMH